MNKFTSQKGALTITTLLGFLITIGMGWNALNTGTNNRQDDKIYTINGDLSEMKGTLKAIDESLKEIKAAQRAELEKRGVSWSEIQDIVKNTNHAVSTTTIVRP